MTAFHALCQACGLSLREAAEFLNVRHDTVKSWSNGRNPAPDSVLSELASLAIKVLHVATEGMAIVTEQAEAARKEGAKLGQIALGLASDDYEAQALGWPCVGAQRACLGLTAALAIQAGHHVKIVPRGSTVVVAAAADLHDQTL